MGELSVIMNRVSTADQHPELQLKDCQKFNTEKGWNLAKVFTYTESAFKEERKQFDNIIQWCKDNQIKHIVVWKMDRFTRWKPETALIQVKMLKSIHNIQIHAVKGDEWAKVVESISSLDNKSFIGQAISEFLETLLKGLELQRAYMESKDKSDRVKMALRKKGEVTVSYKGNKWGRKSISTFKRNQIRELKASAPGLNIRQIAASVGVSKSKVAEVLKDGI